MQTYIDTLMNYRTYKEKQKVQMILFITKMLQYEHYCGKQSVEFNDLVIQFTCNNELEIFKQQKGLFKKKLIHMAHFHWYFDYYKWHTPGAPYNLCDYIHDSVFIAQELDNDCFKYEISSDDVYYIRLLVDAITTELDSTLLSIADTLNVEMALGTI